MTLVIFRKTIILSYLRIIKCGSYVIFDFAKFTSLLQFKWRNIILIKNTNIIFHQEWLLETSIPTIALCWRACMKAGPGTYWFIQRLNTTPITIPALSYPSPPTRTSNVGGHARHCPRPLSLSPQPPTRQPCEIAADAVPPTSCRRAIPSRLANHMSGSMYNAEKGTVCQFAKKKRDIK